MTEFFGQLRSEKLAKDRQRAHEIVREILNLGVSDTVIANVIFDLAMNVENIEQSQHLASAVKEIMPEAFITLIGEEK